MISDYVDLIFSTDTLPSSMIGNLADKLEDIKAIIKNVMYRKWMSDNNFFKEIAEFTTLSDDNKPIFAMGDDFKAFVSNLLVAITPIFKDSEKFVDNINTTLEKTGAMNNNSGMETDDDTSGYDASGSDESSDGGDSGDGSDDNNEPTDDNSDNDADSGDNTGDTDDTNNGDSGDGGDSDDDSDGLDDDLKF
jgi:hypothetical protein